MLNGNAATSSCTPFPAVIHTIMKRMANDPGDMRTVIPILCILHAQTAYSALAGADDVREASLEVVQSQLLETFAFETSETENPRTSSTISGKTAMIGHRDLFAASSEHQCAVRLRLTASQPRQVSSAWYSEPLPVLQGFETRFTFQITDQSKHCFEVRDQNFGTRQYQSCMVHGGDGFAFVLHSHPNKTATVGAKNVSARTRSHLGFEGLANSLAIEFDSWFNVESPDTFYDHITIYSSGSDANSVAERSRLSASVIHDLADGRIHIVKIRYYNELMVSFRLVCSWHQALTHRFWRRWSAQVCVILLVDFEFDQISQRCVRRTASWHARGVHGRRDRERHAHRRHPHQPRSNVAVGFGRSVCGTRHFSTLLVDRSEIDTVCLMATAGVYRLDWSIVAKARRSRVVLLHRGTRFLVWVSLASANVGDFA